MTFSTLRRHFLFGRLALVLGTRFSAASFAADLLDDIKARGSIKVGLEGTYPPFNYQDTSGKLLQLMKAGKGEQAASFLRGHIEASTRAIVSCMDDNGIL